MKRHVLGVVCLPAIFFAPEVVTIIFIGAVTVVGLCSSFVSEFYESWN